MPVIDINCDMGEGVANDEQIMPFITSVNIACGYHAGDDATMKRTIIAAAKNNLAIGAHPSYADRENFGRKEKNIPPEQVYDLVILQLRAINAIAEQQKKRLHHVKPHGALYNMSANDTELAGAIAQAVKDFDEALILYGLSGSHLISEARRIGLRSASEVFADRTYDADGNLTSRSSQGALIEDPEQAVRQALQLVVEKKVTSVNKTDVLIVADTICIHGDGPNAVEFARGIFQALKQNNVEIRAI